MGMSEYEVDLAEASTPEQMQFVAQAFRAGENKAKQRIIEIIAEEEALVAKLILDSNYVANLIEREYDVKANG